MISTAEINKMPIKDRIVLMEEIWNTLRSIDNPEIESPEWHSQILQERLNKNKKGKATYITTDDLKTKD